MSKVKHPFERCQFSWHHRCVCCFVLRSLVFFTGGPARSPRGELSDQHRTFSGDSRDFGQRNFNRLLRNGVGEPTLTPAGVIQLRG